MPVGRIHTEVGATVQQPGVVASLHLDSRAAAQASELPEGNGFLIRVWGPGRLHEYGGDNANCVSLVVKFTDDGVPVLDNFYWYRT